MKWTILCVVLLLGIASAGKRWLSCEDVKENCNKNNGKESRSFCGLLPNGEYKTFNGTCEVYKALRCDCVQEIHNGKCGECNKDDICLDSRKSKKRYRSLRYGKKRRMERSYPVYTTSGKKFNSSCEYQLANCAAVKKGDSPMEKKGFMSMKCNKLELMCTKKDGKDRIRRSPYRRSYKSRRGHYGKPGSKRGHHGYKKYGYGYRRNHKNHQMKFCLISNDGQSTMNATFDCEQRDKICGGNNYRYLHKGVCGNCSSENVCRMNKDSCPCKFSIKSCEAAKNGEPIPNKCSYLQKCKKEAKEKEDNKDGKDSDNSPPPPPTTPTTAPVVEIEEGIY